MDFRQANLNKKELNEKSLNGKYGKKPVQKFIYYLTFELYFKLLNINAISNLVTNTFACISNEMFAIVEFCLKWAIQKYHNHNQPFKEVMNRWRWMKCNLESGNFKVMKRKEIFIIRIN